MDPKDRMDMNIDPLAELRFMAQSAKYEKALISCAKHALLSDKCDFTEEDARQIAQEVFTFCATLIQAHPKKCMQGGFMAVQMAIEMLGAKVYDSLTERDETSARNN
jgi:hypothetical protein